MQLSRLIAALLAAAAVGGAHAGEPLLAEGFEDFASISSKGWFAWNMSTDPAGGWFQGNPGVFTAASGPESSYAAANFLGSAAGSLSVWLVTPEVQLAGATELHFQVRTEMVDGMPFTDGLRVLFGEGSSADPANFGKVLMYLGSVPPLWIDFTIMLPVLSGVTSGRIAFEYTSPDTETANYIGLDGVSITSAVPEPMTALLMSLGIAGLALQRQRRNI